MYEPDVTFSGDVHRYVYLGQDLEVLLDRFVEDRREGLIAEVAVRTSRQPKPGLLHRARLNLVSTRSRSMMVTAIERRTNGYLDDVDVAGIIEQVCYRSLERWRQGEPLVDLRETPARETKWLLRPFLEQQGATILFGDGGTGKSFLGLWWAIQCAHLCAAPGLYLDWEADKYVHAERLAALGGAGEAIMYRREVASLGEGADTVKKEIASAGICFVVIDSWGAARGGDADSSELTIRAFAAARSLGVPWMAIDHLPKNAKDRTKPFGSVYTHNLARLTWRAEAVQEEGSGRLVVSLRNCKANSGRLWQMLAYNFAFEGSEDELTGLMIDEMDVGDVPELADRLPDKQRILKWLAESRLGTVDEIAAALDIGREVVRVRLYDLVKRKRVVRLAGGAWGLATERVET